MSRPINYKDWFYKYHKYTTGMRDEIITYNDTKWKTINDRLQPLVEQQSTLIDEQPFMVVGNNYGFDRLLNLMQDSNYTFDDVDSALVETYKINYKNAMSRMVVNTHAVMCSFTNRDKRNVSYEPGTNYYVIDVPYDQMHFGERDEFIRQRLQQMHVKSTNVWITLDELNTIGIYKEILEFSIMITMNGLICNDCMVAFDDKGMMFKVKWTHSNDFKCIVYKLDTSNVYTFDMETAKVAGVCCDVPWKTVGDKHVVGGTRLNGIVDMYFEEYRSSMNVCGNICYIDENGIHIPHVQNMTNQMITDNSVIKKIHFVVYELKYFFEIPNVYPAMNYYDMMERNRVMVDDDNVVSEDSRVWANVNNVDYTVHRMTPPICIDRDSDKSYQTMVDVSRDRNDMMLIVKTVTKIGVELQRLNENTSPVYVKENIITPIEYVYNIISRCRVDYLKFAALTSMVEFELIRLFDSIWSGVKSLYDNRNEPMLNHIQPDIFFGNNYQYAVDRIYSVLDNEMFSTMKLFNSITRNFIEPEYGNRFNRPVSEQCFIVMKYDVESNVWLFDMPTIKHFNGLQNAFYIDTGITGKEIFKFFVLYTDTEAPGEKYTEYVDADSVFDFDIFYKEIEQYQSFIRYWNVENKLLKMSEVMFDSYDGSTCVDLMSKMMKRRIGTQMIKEYPSDINYELSGVTTNGFADDISDESPFTINYLFYTLNLFYGQKDADLSYFLYRLTHDSYSERYVDIDIADVVNTDHSQRVNYSYFNTASNTIVSSSALKSGNNVYDGLPYIVNGSGIIINTPYRYMFNDDVDKHYLVYENDIVDSFYCKTPNSVQNVYSNDVELCRRITRYMSMTHDTLSTLWTNYEISFNQTKLIEIYDEHLTKMKNDMEPYLTKSYAHPDSTNICTMLFGPMYTVDNSIYNRMWRIRNGLRSLLNIWFNNRNVYLSTFIQEFNGLMKRIYVNYGFKEFAVPRARKLYIHLKKINLTMNLYEFKEWVSNIDYDFIANIESYIGNNTLYQPVDFATYQNKFEELQSSLPIGIQEVEDAYTALSNEYNGQFVILREYVWDIINTYIFDMYRMNVHFNPVAINGIPYYATITLPSSDHTTHPVTGDVVDNVEIVLYPKYQQHGNEYEVLSLVPICEYAFFDNTGINNVDVVISTSNGNVTLHADLTFSHVGSSADMIESIDIINNLYETKVDIQNIHETFEVVDGQIVNHKYGTMNYELLIGNHFDQLEHNSELVLDRESMLPGSIDRIYLKNQTINDYTVDRYGNHHTSAVYFKPSMILHLPIEDGVITSVYGPYTVGQRIYLENAENDYRFPAIITTIDHSQSRGFIEAKVDNAEWLELTDKTRIKDYLDNEIECHIIPDNISNYLNEYNDTNIESYDIIEMNDIPYEEMYNFPGDPIFVQNNANYVYTRLNWMLNDSIPNRFIDDEHKQYQFKYIGEYQIYESDIPLMPYMNEVNHYYDSLRYLEADEWFDIKHTNPLSLTANSIGEEHELCHTSAETSGTPGSQNYNGLQVKPLSLDNTTIYVVFKRTDFGGNSGSGLVFPNNILSTANELQEPWGSTEFFMIGCRNDTDNLNKICFYGGAADVAGDYGTIITSDVTADDYHVAVVTFRTRDDTRYVALYVDGEFVDEVEHNYLFLGRLGINQTAMGDMNRVFGGGGTTHIKFIATVDGVSTSYVIRTNSEWLYERYCDPDTKVTHPVYDSFRINMINHNVDPLTLSEIYPILRTEPDDHDVWDGEIAVFQSKIDAANVTIKTIETQIETLIESLEHAATQYAKDRIIRDIEECEYKLSYWKAFIKRMEFYIRNLEKPSTWYNISSYNAALVYIDNGKAQKTFNSFVECITDIPYTDELELYMYDCQNRIWVTPSDYTTTVSIVDGVKFNNPDDFSTNNVLHSIDVELLKAHVTQKLLVYIGFKKSNMFESIEHNAPTCDVRFKPLLSINRNLDTDIYKEINVRKHFSGTEVYKYTEDNLPNDIDKVDILEGFMVERPLPIGKYTTSPVYRFRDITINNEPFDHFDFYIPMEFKDVDTNESSDTNIYTTNVNVPVDSYQTNTKMTLICVDFDKYNGLVSTLSFEAVSGDSDVTQSFTITGSSELHLDEGTYICTVEPSVSAYKSCGGLITVTVIKDEHNDFKCGNWMKINNPEYHIIPKRFVVSCPTEGGFPYILTIENRYYNDPTKWLNPDNSQPDDPYEYYYDTKKHVRYPISDTRHDDKTTRLAINTATNPNIELIKSPYIGICRYSLNKIPENGVIDMTGHIPTPLTRDRYEFWVNGRCIKDTKSLHIISPTSIQLCNLNSLHNFECIELVDDVYDSELLPHGNVYVDLYGNYYHTNSHDSFMQMMINNSYIIDQRIDYIFNNLQHNDLYEYTGHIINNPNNHDVEINILDGLILNETSDYRKFIHLPTINGVTIYNLSIKDLGLREIDNNKILNMYNRIWKHEAITNPYIPLHHTTEILNIPIIQYTTDIENDCYRIKVCGQYDGFFTIYISNIEDGMIDDVVNTMQIIPFVNCGIEIILSGISTYKKKYVHTTAYSQPKKLN